MRTFLCPECGKRNRAGQDDMVCTRCKTQFPFPHLATPCIVCGGSTGGADREDWIVGFVGGVQRQSTEIIRHAQFSVSTLDPNELVCVALPVCHSCCRRWWHRILWRVAGRIRGAERMIQKNELLGEQLDGRLWQWAIGVKPAWKRTPPGARGNELLESKPMALENFRQIEWPQLDLWISQRDQTQPMSDGPQSKGKERARALWALRCKAPYDSTARRLFVDVL